MPLSQLVIYNRKLRKVIWEGEVIVINLTSSFSCNAENTNWQQLLMPKMENGIYQVKTIYCLLPYGVNNEIHSRTAWLLSVTVSTSTVQFQSSKNHAFSKKLLSNVEPVATSYSTLEFYRT